MQAPAHGLANGGAAACRLVRFALRTVRTRSDGPSLNQALARAAALQLAFCVLYAAGIIASGGITG